MNDTTKEQIRIALEAMRTAGITTVRVTFDGCGDSGQIDEIEYVPKESVPSTPLVKWTKEVRYWDAPDYAETKYRQDEMESSLDDLLEDIVYQLLEDEHDGWEINEGAFGCFTFTPADNSVAFDYNQRFEESELTEHRYKV